MKIFGKEQFVSMPWKNGGGTTTELIRIPANASDFTVRISIAQVSTDGPFSLYPGIERHLLILEGEGVMLRFIDQEISLTQKSQPFSFDGEIIIDCKLINGPVKDFNVMLKKSFGKADVEVIDSPEIKCEDKILYVYSCEENRLFELTRGERIKLKGKCIAVKIKKGP